MISYQEALDIIRQHVSLLPIKEYCLDQSLGHTVAKDIISHECVPSADNSAMDGYAVRYCDIQNASIENPISLTIAGSSMAGDAYLESDLPCSAWSVMTGALVPPYYDAVIRLEDVVAKEQTIIITSPVSQGNNIRPRGSDIATGTTLLPQGSSITLERLMPLHAAGIKKAYLYTKPSCALITTGKEIISSQEDEAMPWQVRNSNLPYLLAQLNREHIPYQKPLALHDEPQLFIKHMQLLLTSKKSPNVIVSTGAVSRGKTDFIAACLEELGATILFHGVKIRPGKPILLAQLPNGALYFGLPGNPIATAAGWQFFIRPALKMMQGVDLDQPLTAILSTDFAKKTGFRFFYRGTMQANSSGALEVARVVGQESYKTSSMLKANCWIVAPESQNEYTAGETIHIYPFYPTQIC